MNELPIMPIRAKYADETIKGINIDEALQGTITDIDAVEGRVETLEDKTQAITHSEAGTFIDSDITISDGNLTIGDGTLSTPVLTSDEDKISAQKPVVEVMTGYTFTKTTSSANFDWTYVYAGIVKNGNKLTACMAVKVKRKADVVGNVFGTMGIFNIPAGIGALLFPVDIGGTNLLDARLIEGFTDSTTSKTFKTQTIKPNNTAFYTNIVLNNDMDLNVDYYLRLELTFLLSDNLAA